MYEHRVWLIFDPGAERGFVYTSGLACEFFALDVPVHMAKDVAGMMNVLSARAVRAEEVCQQAENGQLYRLLAVGTKRRRQLMRTHLTQVTGATVLQLVPIGGRGGPKSQPMRRPSCQAVRAVDPIACSTTEAWRLSMADARPARAGLLIGGGS
jgi:hypothetical protein